MRPRRGAHPQAERPGDGRRRLAGPLQRRGVDGARAPSSGRRSAPPPLRPGPGPSRRGGARRPGPAASCRSWASCRGGRAARRWPAGALRLRRVARSCGGGTGGCGHGMPIVGSAPWRPTGRRGTRWPPCSGTWRRAGAARGWSPGARRWRGRAGRPSPARSTGVAACPGSATRGRAWSSSAWPRRRTAPTGRAGCSPVTARVTGSSPRCTGPASRRSRPAPRATTA